MHLVNLELLEHLELKEIKEREAIKEKLVKMEYQDNLAYPVTKVTEETEEKLENL